MTQAPHLAVVGNTGSGKSQFLVSLIGEATKHSFAVADHVESVTTSDEFLPQQPLLQKKIRLTDSPGMGDTKGRDPENKAKMLGTMKNLAKLHMLALVFNSKSPRFDGSLQSLISSIDMEFGQDIWKYVVMVFTRWDVGSKKTEEARRSTIAAEWNKTLKDKFPNAKKACEVLKRDVPCFFVDSVAVAMTEKNIEEMKGDEDEFTQDEGRLLARNRKDSLGELDKMFTMIHSRENDYFQTRQM